MDQYPDISPELLERIERYLTSQMEVQEIAAFESDLDSQPLLRAQTDEVRLLITGIREVSLAEKLNGFHEGLSRGESDAGLSAVNGPGSGENVLPDNSPDAVVPKIGGLKRWLVAASVIAVIGIGVWFAMNRGGGDSGIYASYYEKDPGLLSAMGSTSDNYEFDRAMIDYKKGDNEAAIKTWESLVRKAPGNDTLNYFLGSAYLALDNPSKARGFFEPVISKGSGAFYTEACWYAGLALIREGKKAEAIPLISKSDRTEKDALLKVLSK